MGDRNDWVTGLRGRLKKMPKNKAFHMANLRVGVRVRLGWVSTSEDEESHEGIMKEHREFISPHT